MTEVERKQKIEEVLKEHNLGHEFCTDINNLPERVKFEMTQQTLDEQFILLYEDDDVIDCWGLGHKDGREGGNYFTNKLTGLKHRNKVILNKTK